MAFTSAALIENAAPPAAAFAAFATMLSFFFERGAFTSSTARDFPFLEIAFFVRAATFLLTLRLLCAEGRKQRKRRQYSKNCVRVKHGCEGKASLESLQKRAFRCSKRQQ